MTNSHAELLARVPLFSDLERRELESIAASMKERTFDAGDVIATEGEGGVGFFIIESGEASVSVGGQERGKLRSGDYFGEIALLSSSARTATVTADTELRCLGMTFWDFRPLVESNGKIAWKLLLAMGEKLAADQRQS